MPLNDKIFHVLLALADGERHGYAVKQDVEERTDGAVKMGPGTLYETLQRAETRGLIEELESAPAGEREHAQRRYYRLTAAGRRALEAEVRRLSDMVDVAKARVLSGGGRRV